MSRLHIENILDKGDVKKLTEWREYEVSDVISKVIDYRGKTPKKLGSDWSDSGYRALSAKNIKTGKIVQTDSIRYVSEELYKKWMIEEVFEEDILITSEAPLGQIYFWDSTEKIVLSQRLFAVRVNEMFYPKYIFFYMMSQFFQDELNSRATGTTVLGIRQTELLKCKIFAPSYQEQKRIADLLWCIEQKIKSNDEINNNLEQQAQAIFDDMFPDISNGSHTIGDYISPKRGKGLLSKNAIYGSVPVIAGGLEPSTYHNVANTQSPVLAISASGANAGYVSLWNNPIWSSDSSFIDSSMTDDVYFWYALLKKRQKEIFDAQTGSAQPHIYPQHIASMSIAGLDIEKVHSYTLITTPVFEMIGHHKEEKTRLASTRDALLPKLMSGELDISNINL